MLDAHDVIAAAFLFFISTILMLLRYGVYSVLTNSYLAVEAVCADTVAVVVPQKTTMGPRKPTGSTVSIETHGEAIAHQEIHEENMVFTAGSLVNSSNPWRRIRTAWATAVFCYLPPSHGCVMWRFCTCGAISYTRPTSAA